MHFAKRLKDLYSPRLIPGPIGDTLKIYFPFLSCWTWDQ